MDERTKYPRGSPKDILVRLRRSRREVRQILIDVQYVNDNNPNFADRPIDIGRYLVQLKRFDEVIAKVRAVVEAGKPMLPDGILNPLLEKW